MFFINHDDLRSLECNEECISRGIYVTDNINDIKYTDIIYFGKKGLDRKNYIFMNNDFILFDESVFTTLKKNVTIITLLFNKYMKELSLKYHFRYFALLDNESFLNKNSILTAEGVISYLISHRRFPIYQSRILVLGFGHCGKPIVQLLKAFDCYIEVADRNHKEKIEHSNVHYISLDEIDLKHIDIVINTIPSLIIDENQINNAKDDVIMLDIASFPYGIDHSYALKQGLNSVILPEVPNKYAYAYSGKLIADEMERLMKC